MIECNLCDDGRHFRCRGRCGDCIICDLRAREPMPSQYKDVGPPPAPRKPSAPRKSQKGIPRPGSGKRSTLPPVMQHAVAEALIEGRKNIPEIAENAGCTESKVRTIRRQLERLALAQPNQ